MHFFEITDRSFADEFADYLPKEAFKQSEYLLLSLPEAGRTILITAIDKLGELMDGLCVHRHCRRVSKKVARSLHREYRRSTLGMAVGNVELWQRLDIEK